MRAEFAEALELGTELLRLGQRTLDPEVLHRADHALQWTLFRMGEFAEAVNHAEQGIIIGRRSVQSCPTAEAELRVRRIAPHAAEGLFRRSSVLARDHSIT